MDAEVSAIDPLTFSELVNLVDQRTATDGITRTALEDFALFRTSVDIPRTPELEAPALVLLLQGTKVCHYGETTATYTGPQVVVGLLASPVETEFVGASPETPFLAVGIELDISRLAELVVRLDDIEPRPPTVDDRDASVKFSTPLSDELAAPFMRLIGMLDQPADLAILGPAAIDEIYYRLVTGHRGHQVRNLLQQNGKVKRIARAVHHIHEHLDEPVAADQLAELVHMSRTAFFSTFRDVMGSSPLQYVKTVKLLEAQRLIHEGHRVSEAGYAVGYTNLSQFSREYKRQFGHPPSEEATT